MSISATTLSAIVEAHGKLQEEDAFIGAQANFQYVKQPLQRLLRDETIDVARVKLGTLRFEYTTEGWMLKHYD